MKLKKINNKYKIIWERKDFEDHPDKKAIPIECLPKDLVAQLEIKTSYRVGTCYYLPDGIYLFPGDDFLTEIITFSTSDEYFEFLEKNKESSLVSGEH